MPAVHRTHHRIPHVMEVSPLAHKHSDSIHVTHNKRPHPVTMVDIAPSFADMKQRLRGEQPCTTTSTTPTKTVNPVTSTTFTPTTATLPTTTTTSKASQAPMVREPRRKTKPHRVPVTSDLRMLRLAARSKKEAEQKAAQVKQRQEQPDEARDYPDEARDTLGELKTFGRPAPRQPARSAERPLTPPPQGVQSSFGPVFDFDVTDNVKTHSIAEQDEHEPRPFVCCNSFNQHKPTQPVIVVPAPAPQNEGDSTLTCVRDLFGASQWERKIKENREDLWATGNVALFKTRMSHLIEDIKATRPTSTIGINLRDRYVAEIEAHIRDAASNATTRRARAFTTTAPTPEASVFTRQNSLRNRARSNTEPPAVEL